MNKDVQYRLDGYAADTKVKKERKMNKSNITLSVLHLMGLIFYLGYFLPLLQPYLNTNFHIQTIMMLVFFGGWCVLGTILPLRGIFK